MNRDQAITGLKLVEGEYAASKFALARTIVQMQSEPSLLTSADGLSIADLRRAGKHVEPTFVVRLFAQFEAIVRDYWTTIRDTEPGMKDLLDGVAARNSMLTDWLSHAHEVREYRNDVVHNGEAISRLTFTECRSRLCRFLSYLPRDW